MDLPGAQEGRVLAVLAVLRVSADPMDVPVLKANADLLVAMVGTVNMERRAPVDPMDAPGRRVPVDPTDAPDLKANVDLPDVMVREGHPGVPDLVDLVDLVGVMVEMEREALAVPADPRVRARRFSSVRYMRALNSPRSVLCW